MIIDAILLFLHRKHLLHSATAPTCTADALCWSGLMLRTRWRHWDGKQRNIFTVNLMGGVCDLQNVICEMKMTGWCIHLSVVIYCPCQWLKKRNGKQKCWRGLWRRWRLEGMRKTDIPECCHYLGDNTMTCVVWKLKTFWIIDVLYWMIQDGPDVSFYIKLYFMILKLYFFMAHVYFFMAHVYCGCVTACVTACVSAMKRDWISLYLEIRQQLRSRDLSPSWSCDSIM